MTLNDLPIRGGMFLGFGAIVSAGLVTGALAQGQQAAPEPPVDYVEGLISCRKIAEEDQRLACYDAKVEAIVVATDAGDVTIVNRADVDRTRRQLFGFTVPNLGIFKRDETDKEASELLETSITSARRLTAKTWRFTTAEGAVWEISSAPPRLSTIKPGDAVQFKKASLGFYFIRINGKLGVKGKRVE